MTNPYRDGLMDLNELLSKAMRPTSGCWPLLTRRQPLGASRSCASRSYIGPPWERVAATVRQTKAERQAENLRAKAAMATACRRKPRTIPNQITHYENETDDAELQRISCTKAKTKPSRVKLTRSA